MVRTSADFVPNKVIHHGKAYRRSRSLSISLSYIEEPWHKKLKKEVFMFLESPQSRLAVAYHVISPLLVLGSLCFGIAGTMEKYENEAEFRKTIFSYELFLLILFTIEYILRLWSCDYLKNYKGVKGRIRFVTSLYMSIDCFVIMSTSVTSFMEMGSGLTLLRIVRFFQIFRLLRIDRRRGDLITMAKVVREHGKELITCYFIGSIILYCGAYTVYIAERFSIQGEDNNGNRTTIHDMCDSLYWAFVTVTSVGYGEVVPVTWAGKIITCVFATVGCSFFALPAGIIGSGFALQISRRKKLQKHKKLRGPAACLIQRFWRYHAIGDDNREASMATTSYLLSRMQMKAFKKKNNSIFSGDIEGEMFLMSSHSSNMFLSQNVPSRRQSTKGNAAIIEEADDVFNISADRDAISIKMKEEKNDGKDYEKSQSEYSTESEPWNDEFNISKLPVRFRIAISFIHRVYLWIAMKNFKNLRNPFLNMEDMMEKNIRHHGEMLTHFNDLDSSFSSIQLQLEGLQASNKELKSMVAILSQRMIKNKHAQATHVTHI